MTNFPDKKLKHQAIDDLRTRWFSREPYCSLFKHIQKVYVEQYDRVLKVNEESRNKLSAVTISNWLEETSRDMFSELISVSDLLSELDLDYTHPITDETLIDMRGFPAEDRRLYYALLKSVDLSYGEHNLDLLDCSLIGCLFYRTSLRYKSLGHYYKSCYFRDCDMAEFRIRCGYIEDCQFIRCKLRNPQCFRAHVKNTLFDNCSFRSAFFAYSIYIGCTFHKCCMIRADMETSRFINCVFEDCEWTQPSQQGKYTKCEPPIVEEIPYDKIDVSLLKP